MMNKSINEMLETQLQATPGILDTVQGYIIALEQEVETLKADRAKYVVNYNTSLKAELKCVELKKELDALKSKMSLDDIDDYPMVIKYDDTCVDVWLDGVEQEGIEYINFECDANDVPRLTLRFVR